MENGQQPEDAPGRFSLLGTASTMGLHMVSGPLVGGGLGWLLDSWLDSWPWCAGAGLLLGIAAGFRNVWIDARYLIRSEERIDKAAERRAGHPGGHAADRHDDADPCRNGRDDAPDLRSASVIAGIDPGRDGPADLPDDETEEAILRILGPGASAGARQGPETGGDGPPCA